MPSTHYTDTQSPTSTTYRNDQIVFPQYLTLLPQWITWTLEYYPNEPKPRKILKNPLTGVNAKTNDPSTWNTFAVAQQAYAQSQGNGRKLDGVGFVISENDDIVFVDLDGCIDGYGQLTPLAVEAFNALGGWAEWSVSGEGAHILVRVPQSEVFTKKTEGLEIYSRARFIAMTGAWIPKSAPDVPVVSDAGLQWLRDKCAGGRPVQRPSWGSIDRERPAEIEALDRLGFHPRTSETAGRWETGCPFVEDHYSGGDGGSCFMEPNFNGVPVPVFFCPHNGCQESNDGKGRHYKDLLMYLIEHDAEFKAEKLVSANRQPSQRMPAEPSAPSAPSLGPGIAATPPGTTLEDFKFPATDPQDHELQNILQAVQVLGSQDAAGLQNIINLCAGFDELRWSVVREALKGRTPAGAKVLDKAWRTARRARFDALNLGDVDRNKTYKPKQAFFELPQALSLQDKQRLLPHLGDFEQDLRTGDIEKINFPTVAHNVKAVFDHYGINLQYNDMLRQIEMVPVKSGDFRGLNELPAKERNTVLCDLLELNSFKNRDTMREQFYTLAKANIYHPFAAWQEAVQWDGVDRMKAMLDTLNLMEVSQASQDLACLILTRWCTSVVAAVYGHNGVPPRGVLTFTGAQYTGKTTWVKRLLPPPMVKIDILIDPSSVDSVRKATSCLIAEMGELDGNLRKIDIARLKGFLSQVEDEFRLPYDRDFSFHPRKTVFAATVNEMHFLKDETGNSRFWTLWVRAVDLDAQRQIDIRQFWAQVVTGYRQGVPWVMSRDEMALIERNNETHRETSVEEEILASRYDWSSPQRPTHLERHEILSMLQNIGVRASPYRVTAALRKLTGLKKAPMKSIGGVKKRRWPLPPAAASIEKF